MPSIVLVCFGCWCSVQTPGCHQQFLVLGVPDAEGATIVAIACGLLLKEYEAFTFHRDDVIRETICF